MQINALSNNESVHQKEQLASLIKYIYYESVKNVDFIHVYFCDATDSMQYRPPKPNEELSSTNHFGSVSYGIGRIAAACECKASFTKV